ncbi:hypothetical protein EWW49_35045, partial [Pseudomonas syringae]
AVSGGGWRVLPGIALAGAGGAMDALSRPIGRIAGGARAAACYLAVGPLFGTPRTATVSFEVGLAPLTGDTPMALFLYSLVYFLVGFWVSLYPGRSLDTVGRFLPPLKTIALAVLGIAAFALPAGGIGEAEPADAAAPLAAGLLQGSL